MEMARRIIPILRCQRGAVAVVVGIMMIAIVGFVALAVDTGYLFGARNELQNAADAAALASTRQLGIIYQGMSYAEQQAYVADPSTIVPVAQEVGSKNKATGSSITIDASDVTIGTWDGSSFTATLNQPDAVRVIASRDPASPEGQVSTFFAKIFGIDEVTVTADATAALTGQAIANPGELELPIGISEDWFDGKTDWCGDIIKFSPTTDPEACGGWTSFDDDPATDRKLRDILDDMVESPFTYAGQTNFHFINGDLSANTFESLLSQFQIHGYDVDRYYTPTSGEPESVYYVDDDGNFLDAFGNPSDAPVQKPGKDLVPLYEDDGITPLRYPPCSGASGCSGPPRHAREWPSTIVVYEGSDCTPGKNMKVKGFVEVLLYDVGEPSNKTVAARIKCDIVDPEATKGGAPNFGKLGSIPNLVE